MLLRCGSEIPTFPLFTPLSPQRLKLFPRCLLCWQIPLSRGGEGQVCGVVRGRRGNKARTGKVHRWNEREEGDKKGGG